MDILFLQFQFFDSQLFGFFAMVGNWVVFWTYVYACILTHICFQLDEMKKLVAEIAGRCTEDVRVVVSPYRICPLGAHVDHQVCFALVF